MQEIWFSGIKNEEEREKVKQDIALAHNAFKRLSDILAKKEKKSSASDYDRASWSSYQADMNGYNRALQEVLKLIKET